MFNFINILTDAVFYYYKHGQCCSGFDLYLKTNSTYVSIQINFVDSFFDIINVYMYVRVIHHFFKQAQNETAVLNVFQDVKSEISEKSYQN